MNWFDFLDSMMIATEADDITGQAQDGVKGNLGNQTPMTQQPTGDNAGTADPNSPDAGIDEEPEDLGNTDDIFGTQRAQQAKQNAENPDEGTQGDVAAGDDPNLTDEGGEDTSEGTDPNLNSTDENMDDTANDVTFTKKNVIRDNMISLHDIMSSNIDTITAALNNINDTTSLRVTESVLMHLRNAKNYLYKTLTKEIEKLDYEELLRRYITMKRVYDICIKMLETHYDLDLDKGIKAKKKK